MFRLLALYALCVSRSYRVVIAIDRSKRKSISSRRTVRFPRRCILILILIWIRTLIWLGIRIRILVLLIIFPLVLKDKAQIVETIRRHEISFCRIEMTAISNSHEVIPRQARSVRNYRSIRHARYCFASFLHRSSLTPPALRRHFRYEDMTNLHSPANGTTESACRPDR